MQKCVALIHGIRLVIETMDNLVRKRIPDIEVINILDEGLFFRLTQTVSITPEIRRDFCNLVVSAEKAGAKVALVTGSSFTPCVDIARQLVNIPVLKIDEPMATETVRLGKRIGLLATEETTIGPSSQIIEQKAAELGKKVDIKVVHIPEASDLLKAKEFDKFDEIMVAKAKEIAGEVDVIVLAQVSIARAASAVRACVNLPVLSSPETAVEQLTITLEEIEKGSRCDNERGITRTN